MQKGLTPSTVDVEFTIPHKPKTEVFESQTFGWQTLPVRHRMKLAVETAIT